MPWLQHGRRAAVSGNFIFNLVTVFLGSGAAIAVSKMIFEYRKDHQQRADATEYLAIQLAFLLEGYAIECANKANDHRIAKQSDGHAGALIGSIPMPPPFPEGDAYKLLDRTLLNDLLDFPQRCQMANEAAMFLWDVVGDEDSCCVAMEENTVQMGGRAVAIAKKFRIKYKLDSRDLSFGEWDIADFFDNGLKRLAELKRQQAEAEAAASNEAATT
jgi:hypothetical protein